ncbi:MAG: endolytic transglycosylase MltG [Lachnospiraceae bacterium]|nr:endolytic transglycosylase MltG [Lachnospiraceae bacterium]
MEREQAVSKRVKVNVGAKENAEYLNTIIRLILHIVVYGVIIFAIVSFADKAYEFAYQIYGDVAVSQKATVKKNIEIKSGDNTVVIADKLYKEKLIMNKYSFIVRMKLSQEIIKPNTYKLANNMTYSEIIETICATDTESDE